MPDPGIPTTVYVVILFKSDCDTEGRLTKKNLKKGIVLGVIGSRQ